jgi:MFS family permease
MKPLTRPILRRFGFRNVLIGNSALAACGVAIGAGFTESWPIALMFVALAFGGLFRSLQFTALNTLAFAELPREKLSAGTSFYGTAQQLPPALGIALATTSLEVSRHLAGHDALLTSDFTAAFLIAGLVVLASSPLFALLPKDAGAEVSGKR